MVLLDRSLKPDIQELEYNNDIDGLILALGYQEDEFIRLGAVKALGHIGDIRAVEPLNIALKDSNSEVRIYAAKVLGQIGDIRAVESLISALCDSNEYVREYAAYALGEIGDPRAVKPLGIALKDSKCNVRSNAASSLGKIGDLEDIEPLVITLMDTNDFVRGSAVYALGEIGDPRAVKPLSTALLKDLNNDVRLKAAVALGKLGDPKVVEPLIAALKDSNREVRSSAAEALGDLGDLRAVEPLIAALKDSNREVRSSAAEALGDLGDLSAVEPLIDVLNDSNEWVRSSAAEALGYLGDLRAIEPLIAVISNSVLFIPKNGFFLRDAAEALDRLMWVPRNDEVSACYWISKGNFDKCVAIGAPAARPLISTLKNSDYNQTDAAEALGEIGDSRAVEPLIVALKNYNEHVRKNAAEALDNLKWIPDTDELSAYYWMSKLEFDNCVTIGAPAVEPLIMALTSHTKFVPKSGIVSITEDIRKNAAEALGRIGIPAIESLSEVLKDPEIVAGRFEAPGKIKDSVVRTNYITVVRKNAAEALGKIGIPAIESLNIALKDSDSQVRIYAAKALGHIGFKSG